MTKRRLLGIPEREMILLQKIQGYSSSHGFPPAIRDLSDAMSELTGGIPMSTSVIMYYMDDLRTDGYLNFEPKLARTVMLTIRGLELLGIAPREVTCPHCGKSFEESPHIVSPATVAAPTVIRGRARQKQYRPVAA